MANLFRQIAQAPYNLKREGPPAQENEAGDQGCRRNPAGQDELDRQLGRKLYQCQKLVTELQNVECCLLWFRDELPPALLLEHAPGLLGLPQQQVPASNLSARIQHQLPHHNYAQIARAAACGITTQGPSAANLRDAKEYLQAANTRERFMRLWREQAYPAQNIHVPRKVARAKASLSIPRDPRQSFPDREGTMNTMGPQVAYSRSAAAANSGYQLYWTGSYAMNDWQRIVAYLEGKTDNLERAIGACFR